MDRHDGRRPRSDSGLYLSGINVTGVGVDIHEHRLDAIPPQGMGGCNKAERGGDHLTRDP